MCGIDFFKFQFDVGSVFFFKKTLFWFAMNLVKKMRFGSDIIVIYYSCNS